jgi:hypothetical protein
VGRGLDRELDRDDRIFSAQHLPCAGVAVTNAVRQGLNACDGYERAVGASRRLKFFCLPILKVSERHLSRAEQHLRDLTTVESAGRRRRSMALLIVLVLGPYGSNSDRDRRS